MKRAIVLIALALAGCGGSSAPISTAQAQTTPIPPMLTEGDAKTVKRDTSFLQGGQVGYVNTAASWRSTAGADVTSLEWTTLSVLDNYARAGENVAFYAQANKFSSGPTWAAVSEASDTGGSPGALVAHEFDVWTTGPDNGLRIGLEIVNGDARLIRGLGRSPVVETTTAIRVGQTLTTPWASWGTGIDLTGHYRDSAFKITDPSGVVVFEIKPNGDVYKRGVKVL